ncbi:DUF4125 family protein [Miniimonas arenae]|uniref:DUF4125 family protein n=1 Tax=Miniimonas arenae TaxID=676201 RepID=UPI001C59071A|nr:DUF4125 family protein [Miniimonas arenae]
MSGVSGVSGSVNGVDSPLAHAVVAHEWAQFQRTQNEGGRASCQDDWRTFREMRLAQVLTWPEALQRSYADDLDDADAVGRNLVTEKYARMMASTSPARYARDLAPHLPVLSEARRATQEAVIAVQVRWAAEFRERYPLLGAGMRLLRTSQDTRTDTSFETYLRGELGTYSARTFALYRAMVDGERASGGNLTERTVEWTVRLAGFDGLADAEAAQPA